MKKNSIVISLLMLFVGINLTIFFVNKWLEKEIAKDSPDKEAIKAAKIIHKGNQPVDRSKVVEKRESGLVSEIDESSQLEKKSKKEKVPIYEVPLENVILMQ